MNCNLYPKVSLLSVSCAWLVYGDTHLLSLSVLLWAAFSILFWGPPKHVCTCLHHDMIVSYMCVSVCCIQAATANVWVVLHPFTWLLCLIVMIQPSFWQSSEHCQVSLTSMLFTQTGTLFWLAKAVSTVIVWVCAGHTICNIVLAS